jgi:alkylation response protein AidB-like acyl-CoA dehydrogenase
VDFALTSDQTKLQDVCRGLARDFASRAGEHDRDASSPLDDYAALREAGLYNLVVPKEYGGWGGGFVDYVIAAEELAQGSASTALSFNMHCVALALLVYKSPLPAATRQRIADLANGGKLICGLVSEAGHTGLVYSTRACSTTARRTEDGYVLNGRKAFGTMAEASDYAAVFVRPEDSASPEAAVPVLLPMSSPGIRIERVWDTLGMRATRSDTIVLEDCAVPRAAVIEELLIPSMPDFMRDNEASINLPYTAVYLGVGFGALREAIAAVTQRVPVGYRQPLAYLPDVRRRVGLMSAQLEAARRLLHFAAWLLDIDASPRETLTAFLKAKYVVGDAVASVTRSALEIGGAHATFKGSAIERLFRDGATATIMQPHSDVCLAQLGVHELELDPAEIVSPLA